MLQFYRMKKVLLFVGCLLSTWISWAQYKIIDTRSGAEISKRELMHRLYKADIIIMGEEHNDSIAHLAQLHMLQGLYYLTKGNLSLSMEMWERDVQGIMDEYLAGYISEKNFKRESRAWNNYEDYKPLIEFAKTKGIPVICANTPARYTNMVTRGTLQALNKLPKHVRRNYLPPLPVDTLQGRYYEKFLEAMGGHTFPGMYLYQSQNLWDATMAHSILEAMSKDPFQKVLHLNGRFHSDEYLGVAYRVKHFDAPRYQVVTISCEPSESYDAYKHKALADYVILTRAQ